MSTAATPRPAAIRPAAAAGAGTSAGAGATRPRPPPPGEPRVEEEQRERRREEELEARREVAPGVDRPAAPAEPRERRPHARGLVGRVRRHERAARGLGGGAERRGGVARHHDVPVGIPLLAHRVLLAHRDRRAAFGAEADRDDRDVRRGRLGGGGGHVLHRLERLTVAHHHEGAVARRGRRLQQLRSLPDGARQRAAGLPHHARVEVVEEELDRARVGGERREDVAPPGEREQRDAVARRERAEPPHLLLHARQPARPLILREHRQRRVERQHHVDAGRADLPPLESPAGPGECQAAEQTGQAEPSRAPAPAAARALGREPGDERGLAHAPHPARRAPSPGQHEPGEQRRQHDRERQQPRRLEVPRQRRPIRAVHGSGPRHRSRPSSSASAPRAMPNGQRYSSVKRT
jgi:hypothetical protein